MYPVTGIDVPTTRAGVHDHRYVGVSEKDQVQVRLALQRAERPPFQRRAPGQFRWSGWSPEISTTQPIAMRQQRAEAGELHHDRLIVEIDADLIAQHATAPPVVVAPHHGDAHAAVDDFPEELEHGVVPLSVPPPVFEPEIEEITVQDDVRGGGGGLFQPAEKRLLLDHGGRAEVDVGGDEDRFAGFYLMHPRRFARTGDAWKG